MQLTEDERAALERWRFGTGTLDSITRDAYTLSRAMNRLFPVRTYGDLVIRWDDQITPERLVACGFVEETHNYHCGRLMFSKFWSWFYVDKQEVPSYDKPHSMLDVWQLMERCGIEEGGK